MGFGTDSSSVVEHPVAFLNQRASVKRKSLGPDKPVHSLVPQANEDKLVECLKGGGANGLSE